jgi:hypothetical protein
MRKSVGAWNAIPAILSVHVTRTPSTSTSPRVGALSPVASFMNVLLPQPDGPTIATNSPAPIDSVMSSTANASCPS